MQRRLVAAGLVASAAMVAGAMLVVLARSEELQELGAVLCPAGAAGSVAAGLAVRRRSWTLAFVVPGLSLLVLLLTA